jgi:hypothetical protein
MGAFGNIKIKVCDSTCVCVIQLLKGGNPDAVFVLDVGNHKWHRGPSIILNRKRQPLALDVREGWTVGSLRVHKRNGEFADAFVTPKDG